MSKISNLRIGFIGGGNMACALIGGLVKQGGNCSAMVVVEPDEKGRERLARFTGLAVLCEPGAALAQCDAVIFAVKPQQMHAAVQGAERWLGQALVISIAAGIRIADIARWLGRAAPIVRAMPNTPALVGAGISGLFANPEVTVRQRELASLALEAVGRVLWLDNEAQLDVVTALSGSGPAYFFYFMESMQKSAQHLGLNEKQARALVEATCAGAAALAADSGDALTDLRARVTSKGGTTFAALEVLDARTVGSAIEQAVSAATRRAAELGDEFGRD